MALGEQALSWRVPARRKWAPRLFRAGSMRGRGWKDTGLLRWPPLRTWLLRTAWGWGSVLGLLPMAEPPRRAW